MANAFTIMLAGQDISQTVRWYPDDAGGDTIPNAQPVTIDSTLGQGAGNGGAVSGRAAQATFLTRLGPLASAVGAGSAITTTPTQVSNYKTTILGENPLGYWRLGDPVGSTTAADSSGNALTGTVNGSVTFGATGGVAGDANTAAAFTGGYIALPTSTLPTGKSAWTLKALVNPSGIPTDSVGVIVLLGTWGTTNEAAFLCMDNTGKWSLRTYGATTLTGPAATLNTYTVLTATFDGIQTLTLYVNGSVAATGNDSTLNLLYGAASIGGLAATTRRFSGTIDEVVILPYAQTAAQVQSDFTAATTTQTISPAPQLVRQGEVTITDPNGVRVFGGFVGKLDDASNRTHVYTQVSCYDYWQALAHITINEVFDGISDIAVIRSLITKYAPWVDLSLLPTFTSGTLLGQVWRNKSLQWGIQKVADITGRQVYIDPHKRLIYNTPTLAPAAPFTLSDSPDFSTSFPHAIDTFTIDDTAIINRVTLYGGKRPTPDFAQDISTQANGSNTVFMLAYYPRKSSSGKVIVTVNGTQLALGYAIGTGSANQLISQGGSADVLLNADARTLTFDIPPAAGATVICIYRYQLPLVVQLTEKNSYAFFGQYYDGVISDETVVDSATAIQRCRVLLLEQAYGLTTIKLRCWRGGLQAGQLLTLTNTVRGLTGVTYIIQEVSAKPVTPLDVEYTVTLGAWNWNLVDVLSNLAVRTAGQDLAQQETITPTQVNIPTALGVSLAVVVKPATRPMAQYSPGVTTSINQTVIRKSPFTLPTVSGNTTGAMYPGLFSI